MLGHDLVVNNGAQVTNTQNVQNFEQHQARELHSLCLNDELTDHSTIDDLQHLVGQTELNTEGNEINRMIEFQEDEVNKV